MDKKEVQKLLEDWMYAMLRDLTDSYTSTREYYEDRLSFIKEARERAGRIGIEFPDKWIAREAEYAQDLKNLEEDES